MIEAYINELRLANGRHPVKLQHEMENYHCRQHCYHMAFVKDAVHAPGELLHGKSEAIAMGTFAHDPYATLRMLILKEIGESPGHRNIVLFHDNLAAAFCVDYYNVYITIRAW